MIPFNQPFLTGKETEYIVDAVNSKKLSGNGKYTKKCQSFFEDHYKFKKALLTSSCTDALEMASLLADIQPGDEVIMPTYTFVSTANAFVLRGATIVFADSEKDHPNIDVNKLEGLITPKTKAIVPVHYAGVACDMDPMLELAKKYDIKIIEDAAQAFDSFYKGKPLGGIGDFGAFSFHETKNIISGEGGLLSVNKDDSIGRSEIIWEKGTNRAAFFRGEIDKYGWVDVGSSFLPSEVVAAFLYAQIENQEKIQTKRVSLWNQYYDQLSETEAKGFVKLPKVPSYATNNAHMFYLVCNSAEERQKLIEYLRAKEIHAVFHYLSLHKSVFFQDKYKGEALENADNFSQCLIRLPLYYDLTIQEVSYISDSIKSFFE
ncbi:dTDP-4-amino-4,6-dideoxygalactose transaminase [Crocinitomix catalasitica]|uniref:dTDP-4-amino-4,6-dideoxygalactose transaminase n=1 Tax=Crocinitomix catalasitica TaxID=184607 RepID=UPI000488376A|nr:dTDP-4-amino-4,6-dideoxygalactose transaminase [Crocinitomix catalasitica]